MSELRGCKFVTTLVLVFKRMKNTDKSKFNNFYSNSKVEIIINETDIENVFKSIYTTIITNIANFFGKDSGWPIDSVID